MFHSRRGVLASEKNPPFFLRTAFRSHPVKFEVVSLPSFMALMTAFLPFQRVKIHYR
jgi:hypothetical protein